MMNVAATATGAVATALASKRLAIAIGDILSVLGAFMSGSMTKDDAVARIIRIITSFIIGQSAVPAST